MISATLAVESTSLTAREIARVLSLDASRVSEIGSESRHRPGYKRKTALWELELIPPGSHRDSTEGVSFALLALGNDFSGELRSLSERGCSLTVSVLQEFYSCNGEVDSESMGFHLSSEALEWMAQARVCLDIDQYVYSEGTE